MDKTPGLSSRPLIDGEAAEAAAAKAVNKAVYMTTSVVFVGQGK